MASIIEKHPDLLIASFRTGPSNKPGSSLYATLQFGEAVVRLPHRTIRFGVDCAYIRLNGSSCEVPEDSWEHKRKAPNKLAVEFEASTTSQSERTHTSQIRSSGTAGSIDVGASADLGGSKKASRTDFLRQNYTREVTPITAYGHSTSLTLKINALPGDKTLSGHILDDEIVARVISSGDEPEMKITGEIPANSVHVIGESPRAENKNRYIISKILFAARFCDKQFQLRTLSSAEIHA